MAGVLWKKVCDHVIKACIKMHMPKINQWRLHGQAYFWHALTFAYEFKMFFNVIFYTRMFNKIVCSPVNEYSKQQK